MSGSWPGVYTPGVKKEGLLDGDGFARKSLNRMTPLHFFEEKNDQDWIILTISADKKTETPALFPEAVSLLYTKDVAAFAAAYEKALNEQKHKGNTCTQILIVDERGIAS